MHISCLLCPLKRVRETQIVMIDMFGLRFQILPSIQNYTPSLLRVICMDLAAQVSQISHVCGKECVVGSFPKRFAIGPLKIMAGSFSTVDAIQVVNVKGGDVCLTIDG